MKDLQAKFDFLNWIILHHPHPNREIMVFLAYLQMKPEELHWVEFSHDVIYAPRGIKIFYQTNQQQPLIYYKEDYIYHRVDQAFHDFRLNSIRKEQVFFFEFDFAEFQLQAMRSGVFKENPFVPMELKVLDQVSLELKKLSQQAHKSHLMRKIDQALENKDFDAIEQWMEQYRSDGE